MSRRRNVLKAVQPPWRWVNSYRTPPSQSIHMMNSLRSIIKWQICLQEHRMHLQVLNTTVIYFSGSAWRKEERKRWSILLCHPLLLYHQPVSMYVNVSSLSWGINIYKLLPLYSRHSFCSLDRTCYVNQRLFARILCMWIFVTYIFAVQCHMPLATQRFNLNKDYSTFCKQRSSDY